jgi:hypothetical protein
LLRNCRAGIEAAPHLRRAYNLPMKACAATTEDFRMHFADTPHLMPADSGPIAVPFASRFSTAQRLVVTEPAGIPAVPRTTVANLKLPAAQVQERAAALVEQARASGRGHSLRLWRLAQQTALQDLAREASGLPASTTCHSFSWEARGEAYHVMATFVPRRTVH